MLDLVEPFHHALRWVHIACGAIGLVLFWVPILAPKGGPLHRRAGRWFVRLAWVVGLTGLASSLWALASPETFMPQVYSQRSELGRQYLVEGTTFFFSLLAFLSMAMLTGLVLGVAAVRLRHRHEELRSTWVLGWQVALGLTAAAVLTLGLRQLTLGWQGAWPLPKSSVEKYWLLVILGGTGLMSMVSDVRYILRPRPAPGVWLHKHLGNMIGVGIAFYTAFLVFGLGRVLDSTLGLRLTGAWQLLPWIIPSAVGIPAAQLWVRRLRPSQPPAEQPAPANYS